MVGNKTVLEFDDYMIKDNIDFYIIHELNKFSQDIN